MLVRKMVGNEEVGSREAERHEESWTTQFKVK